jgi:hypothetical protein
MELARGNDDVVNECVSRKKRAFNLGGGIEQAVNADRLRMLRSISTTFLGRREWRLVIGWNESMMVTASNGYQERILVGECPLPTTCFDFGHHPTTRFNENMESWMSRLYDHFYDLAYSY